MKPQNWNWNVEVNNLDMNDNQSQFADLDCFDGDADRSDIQLQNQIIQKDKQIESLKKKIKEE